MSALDSFLEAFRGFQRATYKPDMLELLARIDKRLDRIEGRLAQLTIDLRSLKHEPG